MIAFSADNNLLVSSWGERAYIWETKSLTLLRKFDGIKDYISSIAISPDKKILVIGEVWNISIWDIDTGQNLKSFKGNGLNEIALSPNTKTLFSSGNDLRSWDMNTGQSLYTYEAIDNQKDSSFLMTTTLNKDGTLIVAGNLTGVVMIRKTSTGELVKKISAHDKPILSVRFNPDEKLLATASSDGTVRLWNAKTYDLIQTFQHQTAVLKFDFSPDGSKIVSATNKDIVMLTDNNLANKTAVHIWDVKTGQRLKTISDYTDKVSKVEFSPDSQQMIFANTDGTIKAFAPYTRKYQYIVDTPYSIRSISVHPSGKSMLSFNNTAFNPGGSVITATVNNKISFWNTSDGKFTGEIDIAGDGIFEVFFNLDRRTITVRSFNQQRDREGIIYDRNTSSLLDFETRKFTKLLSEDISEAVIISRDGQLLAGAVPGECSTASTLGVWKIETGDLLFKVYAHCIINSTIFDVTRQVVLTAGWDSAIKAWNINNGHLLYTLDSQASNNTVIVFSPDEKIIASGNSQGSIELWDIQNKSLLITLQGHTEEISSIAFSPDGRLLASGSSDGTVRLWGVKP